MSRDISKESIRAARHEPTFNSESLNRAMEKAITDESFLDMSINLLNGLKFPALKGDIVKHIEKVTTNSDVISLFQSLDGYIQFKDPYHVRKAIEENDPKKKTTNQITTETRENPVHTQTTRQIGPNSIKSSQAVTESEERKDFPEVNPTARTEFVCQKCGKSFHASDDLARHKRFEEGEQQERKISQKSRIERERTVPISSGETSPIQSQNGEQVKNQALDTMLAAQLANLLEGLNFPATKEEVVSHIHKHAVNTTNQTQNDISSIIQSNLENNTKYNSAYEIEKATKLVVERE